MPYNPSEFDRRFEECIQLFARTTDRNGDHLQMLSLWASNGNQTAGASLAGSAADEATDLRSVSKVALVLTVGAMIEHHPEMASWLGLNARVGPTIAGVGRIRDSARVEEWSDVEVRHLLSNTIGHDQGFLFRKDIGERDRDTLLEYVFERPISHAPGTHFSYSNVGPFLVSVLVQEITGRRLSEWADELIFRPMGISFEQWYQYGRYDAGCSGLVVGPAALHALALLLRDRGEYKGRRVVGIDWCTRMSTPSVATPLMCDPNRVLPKAAYGLGMWICPDGRYYCDGTDGQYLIVDPARDLAITTLGAQPDMKPITRCMIPLF